MEGLAGAVLGGTLIQMRDVEDRRAAERRLVQDAQNGDLRGLRAPLPRERAEGVRLVPQAVVRRRAGRRAHAGGLRAGLAQARELPRGERLLVLALPPHGERGAQRAPVAAAPGRPDLRDRRPGEPRAGAALPRPERASTSRRPWRPCPPARGPCSCSTTWKAGLTTRSRRCWTSPPGRPRRSCSGPGGCSGRHSDHDVPGARRTSRRLGRRGARRGGGGRGRGAPRLLPPLPGAGAPAAAGARARRFPPPVAHPAPGPLAGHRAARGARAVLVLGLGRLEPVGPRGRGHGRRRPRGRPVERPGPVGGEDGGDPGRDAGGEAGGPAGRRVRPRPGRRRAGVRGRGQRAPRGPAEAAVGISSRRPSPPSGRTSRSSTGRSPRCARPWSRTPRTPSSTGCWSPPTARRWTCSVGS